MIIQAIICDHCHTTIHGGSFESYRVGGAGPVLQICAICQRKPFRSATPSPRGIAIAETVRLALSAL